jgi:hypothetical protein
MAGAVLRGKGIVVQAMAAAVCRPSSSLFFSAVLFLSFLSRRCSRCSFKRSWPDALLSLPNPLFGTYFITKKCNYKKRMCSHYLHFPNISQPQPSDFLLFYFVLTTLLYFGEHEQISSATVPVIGLLKSFILTSVQLPSLRQP